MSTFKTGRKFASIVLSAATVFSLGGGAALVPAVASAQTADASTIAALQAQIALLTAQLSALAGGSSSVSTGSSMGACSFTEDLKQGSSSEAVKCLQWYLNSNGYQVSASGAGSPGQESMYFGAKTKAAVSAWQAANGVSPAAGYFGAKSRAKYASLSSVTPPPPPPPCTGAGCVTPPPVVPPPSGAGLSVVAATQPANSIAPTSASRLPFTKVTLTAGASDVTVNNITVERVGLGVDANFAGIVLVDENGSQIGIAKTLNSDHKVSVGDPFVVKAGTSKTVTIAGNMASSLGSYAGQVVGLSVSSINTASGSVSGTLPIVGAYHTINATLGLGTAAMTESSFDPDTAVTKNIGDTNYKFAGVRLQAGSAEKVYVSSIRWNQTGSAGANDLANLMVNADGKDYPVTVSADGKYFTAMFTDNGGKGILVDKGNSIDVYIKGDIVGSSSAGRTVQFDIYKATDVVVYGETYGYGITPTQSASATATTASEFTSGTPFFSGSTITVSAGSVTSIAKAGTVAAQNVAANVSNQILGGFEVDIKGEAISVQSTVFHISGVATTTTNQITNISLVGPNGNVVAGPVDASANVVTFTDTITFPVGKGVYTLKGKIPSAAANNGTFTVSTNPSSLWSNITGQTSGNTISLSTNGSFSMNTVTVKAGSLTISVPTSPVAQNVVAGTNEFLFAKYQLDASSSGEDLRFSSIPLQLTFTGGAPSLLTACKLLDGTTTLNSGTNIVNPSGTSNTFTFDNSLTVTKGTVKTLDLRCNLSGSATTSSTFAWGIASSPSITVTGVTSSNEITESVTSATGQAMTVAAGSFTVGLDSTSPSNTVVSPSSSDVILTVLKFRASNESLRLDKLALQIGQASTSLVTTASSSPADLVDRTVTLWDGSTQVGTAVFTSGATTTTVTLSSSFILTKDTDKLLTLKGKLAPIGSNEIGASGRLIQVDYDGSVTSSTQAIGSASTAIDSSSSSDTASAGLRVFKSYPTLALETLPSSGVSDGRLLRFKVTANSNGEIGLAKFGVTIATTSSNVTGVNIFGFTDSSFSSPISGVTSGGQVDSSNKDFTNGSSVYQHLEFTAKTAGAATTTIQVPAGQTRYFEVRGTVTGTATTYSVTTTLEGDSAFPALVGTKFMDDVDLLDADANDDFLWSPNATTSSLVTHEDWTNGYALPGFPANGLIQSRSN